MPLYCENADIGHASLYRQFKYEITWIAEKNYSPGTMIELRPKKWSFLIYWRFMKWYFDKGEIIWTFPKFPNSALDEIISNVHYTIFRAKLTNGIRRGETAIITLYAVPHI